jgi:phosphohistidine phosphatase SixA
MGAIFFMEADMDVYLMRSGTGLPGDVDPARPLTPVARGLAQKAARVFVRLGVSVEAVACAGTLRAAQTAKIVAEALGFPEKAILADASLSGTGQVEAAMTFLGRLAPARSILCCGHAPLLEHLASTLICGGPAARIHFEPGGVALLEVPEWPTRAAVLHWLSTPAQMRLLAAP